MTDQYIRMVFEHDLECLKEEQKQEVVQMIKESAFIMEALESGYIPVDEAIKIPGVAKSAYETFLNIVTKLSTAFTKAANIKAWKAFGKDGVSKLEQNRDTLIERALELQPRKMTPCWRVDWKNSLDEVTKCIEEGFDNVKNKRIDQHNWIPSKLDPAVITDPTNTELSALLKTYFLIGQTKPVRDMRQTVDGRTIARQIQKMITFVANYENNSKYIAQEFKASAQRRPKDEEMARDTVGQGKTPDQRAQDIQNKTTESFYLDPDMYLHIEDCTVRESLLPLAINYTEVTEADNDAVSPTKIEKIGNPQQQNAEKNALKNVGANKSENAKRNDYCKVVERFQKISQAALQYAFETKFHIYYAILMEIGRDFITPGKGKPGSEQVPEKTDNQEEQPNQDKK